jgi:hypothetical protein
MMGLLTELEQRFDESVTQYNDLLARIKRTLAQRRDRELFRRI